MRNLLFILVLALFCYKEAIAQNDTAIKQEVDMQEFVNDYNSDVSYIGAVFHCPNKMKICNPVYDVACVLDVNDAGRMMCMKSDDSEFELRLSKPLVKTEVSMSDFWCKPTESKLYYDPSDRSRHIIVPGNPRVDSNIWHHQYIVRDGASDVVTRPEKYARDMFNADTVKIYNASANKMERLKMFGNIGNYTHCKIMTIQKHDRGFFLAYCLFTDKAYKKAEGYIGSLKGMISYGNNFVPSWKSYASIEDFAMDEYKKNIKDAKQFYDTDISMPSGYKPYLQTANNKKRILLKLNPCDYFGSFVVMVSDNNKEMLIYSITTRDVLEYEDSPNATAMPEEYKNLPRSFEKNKNYAYPPDSDFSTTDTDGFVSCSGSTEKLDRFMFIEDCDDGNMRLTPLSEIYHHMTIKQKYSGKYRVRIYKFRK